MTCFSTARSVTTSCSAIAAVRAALGHELEDLALARREALERVLAPAAAEQQRDDLGVERRAALGDAPDRVGEAVEVGDAVLEQVAEPVGAVGEQLQRVAPSSTTCDEHEHAGAGQRSRRISAAARRPSSVCVGGMRTSTIATSGLWALTLRSRSSASPAWRDDVEARLLEQARDALAQQHGVVGDDDPHGMVAPGWSCPRRAGDWTSSRPSSAASRSARPRRPLPRAGSPRRRRRRRGPRRPRAVAARDADVRRGWPARTWRRWSATRRRRSRRPPRPARAAAPSGTLVDVDGQRRAVGERLERGVEAAVGQHRRVDAAGQLAQLLERLARAPSRAPSSMLRGALGVVARAASRARPSCSASATSRCWAPSCRSRSRRRRSARPASIRRGARLLELLDAGAQLGVEALVVERQRGGAAAARTSSGSSSSAGSWTIAPIAAPSRSSCVTRRRRRRAARTACPSASTYASRSGSQYAQLAARGRRAPSASASRRLAVVAAQALDELGDGAGARAARAQQAGEERVRAAP